MRSSSRASSTTCFCAPCSARSLITSKTRMHLLRRGNAVRAPPASHPALAPELEGDQVPELLHVQPVVARPALAEVGDRPGHHVRVEESRLADALRIEVAVDERCQLAAQPARAGNGEALLGALEQR